MTISRSTMLAEVRNEHGERQPGLGRTTKKTAGPADFRCLRPIHARRRWMTARRRVWCAAICSAWLQSPAASVDQLGRLDHGASANTERERTQGREQVSGWASERTGRARGALVLQRAGRAGGQGGMGGRGHGVTPVTVIVHGGAERGRADRRVPPAGFCSFPIFPFLIL